MVTQAAFRRPALRLPEAYEDMHRKRPAFRVAKRIFATRFKRQRADSD